jgi:threonine aldolase
VAAIAAANGGTAAGYGGDRWLEEVQRRFAEVFETPRNAPPRVFPVATGTAANALSLAALTPSWGAVYCSKAAHIETSEANATGFFSGGAKLALLDGEHGKIAPQALEQALASAGVGLAHKSQPAALSLTQATDLGAVYALDEIRALAAIARRYKLSVHMDGARLANALARLGCSPAELTWKAGVDVLSFGVTKNGGLLCDAIVAFDPALAQRLAIALRRAGQTWSKMRFAAAQLLAYVEDGLWLKNAALANAAAQRIAAGVKGLPGVAFLAPVQANEVFLTLDPPVMDGLEKDGIGFFHRGQTLARFVCRWDCTEQETGALIASLKRHTALKAASV